MSDTHATPTKPTTPTYRKDYQQPDYFIKKVELCFNLDSKHTLVESTLYITKNTQKTNKANTPVLILNGDERCDLLAVEIDGIEQDLKNITTDYALILKNLPDACIITIKNSLVPETNTAFDGLYISNNIFCTDCEPQGFRKITYFQDRPDNMAEYTVKIIADKQYTQLLSNGNLIDSGDLPNNQHYAIWHDPFPKPSYLCAIVAGDLAFIEDQHLRPDGSEVRLRVYALEKFINQCAFALASLKKAMVWDEQRFGLIYDLDIYNIVAIDDFNAGAMENKGLNIFNTKFVLAHPKTATDADFEGVESVIAHEYFHNWTGNRVTCRDWFQLSLKEGLTVFRDQEFSSDLNHRGLQRIHDVSMLKAHQFTEDAGALAHPIRPDSYIEMRNFYTTTVYEKGAEVVRLYQTLLGIDGFRRGMDLYFKRFDGMAVTCDDFLSAMRDANIDQPNGTLAGFENWYTQAGTPEIQAHTTYNRDTCEATLNLKQILSASPNQAANTKKPQLIPIKVGLIDPQGLEILNDLIVLDKFEASFKFKDIEQQPVFSLLRDFSAPVILKYELTPSQLLHLVKYDSDDFNKFNAAQSLSTQIIINQDQPSEINNNKRINDLYGYFLDENQYDDCIHDSSIQDAPAFLAEILALPDVNALCAANKNSYDPVGMHQNRAKIMHELATKFGDQFLLLHFNHEQDEPGHRALKNISLSFLSCTDEYYHLSLCQYDNARCMTDRFEALKCIVFENYTNKDQYLREFLSQFKDYPLVLDKWFSLQASMPNLELANLIALSEHPSFNYSNPNRMRSLIGVAGQNNVFLHQNPAANFKWLGDEILKIDALNPQIAARLATPFSRWQKFKPETLTIVQGIIKQLLTETKLSKNLHEMLSKSVQE
ncbi:aminopeptidase N [Gammaproteobacteria bacterium]|nr:aminopeptidase N [Gammaproteobacteria bacterium]